LSYLPILPNKLKSLDCRNNKLTFLPNLSNCINTLKCQNNPIYILPILPITLDILYITDTYIENILKPGIGICTGYFMDRIKAIQKLNPKLQTLYKFRELYFIIKYKKYFYKLYEKVMMKRYHPSNLIKLLENVEDDEHKMNTLLESW
jgi:hypothetical protein